MKNIFGFICLFFPFLILGQTVDFKIEYRPEMKYAQTVEQNMENSLFYSGSDEILNILKEKGMQNPTVTKTKNVIESVFKTGKLKADGSYPISVEYLNSINSDNKVIIPSGTMIYGNGSLTTMPKLDSIVSKDMEEAFKKMLLETVQSTFSQLDLPRKKMKIGESFSQETPFTIPIAGISLEMIITTTYKLVSVANKTANFDIGVVYTMKISVEEYHIKGSGSGNGKMLYDTVNNFPTKYDLDNEMVFDMKQEKFNLQIKSKSGFYQTVQISKN